MRSRRFQSPTSVGMWRWTVINSRQRQSIRNHSPFSLWQALGWDVELWYHSRQRRSYRDHSPFSIWKAFGMWRWTLIHFQTTTKLQRPFTIQSVISLWTLIHFQTTTKLQRPFTIQSVISLSTLIHFQTTTKLQRPFTIQSVIGI